MSRPQESSSESRVSTMSCVHPQLSLCVCFYIRPRTTTVPPVWQVQVDNRWEAAQHHGALISRAPAHLAPHPAFID